MAVEKITEIKISSKIYPHRLKHIPSAPKAIYCRGNIELLKSDCIGVVGTRKHTSYGKEACQTIIRRLVESNLTIVSGLALGIDAIAHKSTLDNNGKTIAVLGSSIEDRFIAPQTNFMLARQIIQNGGLILSEYKSEKRATAFTFPARNRIISGLSMGVLVIEADEKSGSLITANCALDQNRDVFAIPGTIFSPKSLGANKLIQRGAKLVISADDIIEEYGQLRIQSIYQKTISPEGLLEEKIIECLGIHGPADLDTIIEFCQNEASKILTRLSIMEIGSKIRQLNSGKYILNNN
ncbi:MAG: Polypeptide deformylase Smf family protein [Candidatus Yanofskybacteria bacterium GW2011_GWD2_39_48]|uniref:Polypeptide deformylase Smf family protein n=1 Tax=Candidatus Yanofskybacteria bacterium GW2011_GWD2_39_48 TaxID=1619031 RepID=A0A0G0RMC7_9BACT|nr:MAG: Polypeptide deformylase Smf family protein [Candidatus Yanofskybacteria bacterium GW2011_GWD2_39_48]